MDEMDQGDNAKNGDGLARFLSISVDVTGSTPAKVALRQFADRHSRDVADAYAAFGQALTHTESRFLNCMANSPEALADPMSLSRLFLLKAIGDEWWYAYDLNDLDDAAIGQHSRQVLLRLLDLLSKSPFDVFFGDHEETHPDGLDEYEEIIRPALGIKITLDLVSGYDYGAFRQKRLLQTVIGNLGNLEQGEVKNNIQRLVGATVFEESSDGKARLARRSDYIGTEVDRFFRLTGKAQPGCVMVGQNLERLLGLEPVEGVSEATDPEWKKCVLRDQAPGRGSRLFHGEILAKGPESFALKGIDEAYSGTLCKDRYSYLDRELRSAHLADSPPESI